MKPRALLPLLALAGAALSARVLRREKAAYPAPESLIIELTSDLLPRPDGRYERHIPLEGAANLRDIGGYRTVEGRYVRWERVYRSGTLAGLTAGDLQQVAALGIRLVCDLRGDDEVRAAPDRLPADVEYVRLPINTDRRGDNQKRLWMLMFDRKRLGTIMREIYRRSLDEHASVYGRAIERLADAGSLPALIHCTAGKDRAGITIALLLLALGVPENVVLADYSLSNQHHEFFAQYAAPLVRRLAVFGVSADDLRPLLSADPGTLKAALDYLHRSYGSAAAYLRDRAGVDDETFERVKANLLT